MNSLSTAFYGIGEAIVLDKVADDHSEQCMDTAREVMEQRVKWISTWPRHCPLCEGAGGVSDYGTHMDPPSFEPCYCQESGQCSRCGAEDTTQVEGRLGDTPCPCTLCGWDPDDPDICPEAHECVTDCMECETCGEPQWDCRCCDE